MFDIRWTYVEYVIWNIISYKKTEHVWNCHMFNIFFKFILFKHIQHTKNNPCAQRMFNIRYQKHVLNMRCNFQCEWDLDIPLSWFYDRAITFYQNLKVYKTVISITYLAVMDENTIKKKILYHQTFYKMQSRYV